MEKKGAILMQRYELGRMLGQGTFAKVYHARNLKTSQSVAIKIIDKEKVLRVGLIDQIKREISVMRLVRHPNVVELYEVMASKTKIYFAMEYVRGGELFNKVAKGKLKEDAARKYFQQLIGAVDYCHSRGVYHRDIKPENLLLDEFGNLKISDFGLSALTESRRQDGLLHTTCGTPAYVAPEVINKKGLIFAFLVLFEIVFVQRNGETCQFLSQTVTDLLYLTIWVTQNQLTMSLVTRVSYKE